MSLLLLFHPFAPATAVQNTKYLLGGETIPRPKWMSREFIWVKSDYISLSGKMTRDYSGRKEKFILHWEFLTPDEVAYIVAEVAESGRTNEPTTFAVNDGDMRITEREVFPRYKTREYRVPNGSYFETLDLELIDVSPT